MKLTFDQLEYIYECSLVGLYPDLGEMTIELNKLIELETCHELALAQNVALDTVTEWINDTNNVNVSRQAEYNGMFMKPAPKPLTRAELLRHMFDNEIKGRELHHGIEIIDCDNRWYPATNLSNLAHPENYRIIK